jgi:hypothetical protein
MSIKTEVAPAPDITKAFKVVTEALIKKSQKNGKTKR